MLGGSPVDFLPRRSILFSRVFRLSPQRICVACLVGLCGPRHLDCFGVGVWRYKSVVFS